MHITISRLGFCSDFLASTPAMIELSTFGCCGIVKLN